MSKVTLRYIDNNEYLQSYTEIIKEIRRKREQLETARLSVLSGSSGGSGGQGDGSSVPERKAVRIRQLEQEIETLSDYAGQRADDINRVFLDQVASPNSRHLLRLFYIRGLSYSEIAKRTKQKRITIYRRIVRTVSRLNIDAGTEE